MSFNERDFELTVVTSTEAIAIRPPFTIMFNADKSIRGALNRLTVNILNLNEKHRLALVKDAEQNKYIPIQLKAGYQNSVDVLFKGSVHRGENSRRGPDLVTTLDCLDGGYDFRYAFTSRVVDGGPIIDAILKDMPNTGRGRITEQRQLLRPKVLVGNSANLITEQLTETETWYIDDEHLNVVKSGEVTSNFIPLVKPSTGLLNTPTRESSLVTFQTLLNPTIKIGRLAKLESITAPHLNGVYRVETISYDCDYKGSNWYQSCTCVLNNEYVVI